MNNKTSVLALMLALAISCRPARPPEPAPDVGWTQPSQTQPEPETKPRPKPAVVAQPGAVRPPPMDPTAEDRLRDVLDMQSAIAVPHDMPDGSAVVVRLEPDGIHVRSMSGIAKIDAADMSADLLAKYHIRQDAADLYRSLAQRQLQRTAAESRARMDDRADAQRAANLEQRREDSARRQQSAEDGASRRIAAARAQWMEYDRLSSQYEAAIRDARRRMRRGVVVTVTTPKPREPSVPRPVGNY